MPRNRQTKHLACGEQTRRAWLDDYIRASVEAKLREFAVAFLKSEAMLPEMLWRELSQRRFAYRAANLAFTAVGNSYLRQGFSQKLPAQIDVCAQSFRQARNEVLNNGSIVTCSDRVLVNHPH